MINQVVAAIFAMAIATGYAIGAQQPDIARRIGSLSPAGSPREMTPSNRIYASAVGSRARTLRSSTDGPRASSISSRL